MLPDRGRIRRGEQAHTAAFFDLDKTIISRSSTLAFAPAFYRHGLISRAQACRAQSRNSHSGSPVPARIRWQRIRDQVSALCNGWPPGKVTDIVADGLWQIIGPLVYAEARPVAGGPARLPA